MRSRNATFATKRLFRQTNGFVNIGEAAPHFFMKMSAYSLWLRRPSLGVSKS